MLRRLWLVFCQAVTVVLALVFVVATLKPQWLSRAGWQGAVRSPVTLIEGAPLPGRAASAPGSSFAQAAQRAVPAVVSITASRVTRRNPHADDPAFRFFFGEGRGDAARQQLGLGSGVIVSPEGYLLTNHHVIEEADEIEVQLVDGRQAAAKLVGSDPETDIAVLKIDLPDLPVVALGNVRELQVGDAVLAIGNPFGVGQTVTAGIVSALDRGGQRLGNSPLQNFIQTDAAINPGNSGGALVDASGRLVGINTAIFSRSGGSMGIGFAVPADTARHVLEQLVANGRVQRGWIGVEPLDLSADLADSLKLSVKRGALVTGVLQDGPAARGGVRPGDVVVQVDDTPVADAASLLWTVATQPPGRRTTLVVVRGAERLKLTVELGDRAAANAAARR
jgi:Do/DeqQ family serine protease